MLDGVESFMDLLAHVGVHASRRRKDALHTCGRGGRGRAARYCLAILASLGKRRSLFFHQRDRVMTGLLQSYGSNGALYTYFALCDWRGRGA